MLEISVIITVYNTEKYLDRCILAILNQSFSDFELVIVDDDSPDQSSIIYEKHAQKDERIRIIKHQTNMGAGASIRDGIYSAKGKYILVLDSDDFIHPQMLELMHSAIELNRCEIAQCKTMDFFDSSEIGIAEIPQREDFAKASVIYANDILQRSLEDELYGVFWNKLIYHKLWDNIDFHTENAFTDVIVCPQLYVKCRSLVMVDEVLHYRYSRRDSYSHTMTPAKKLYSLETAQMQYHVYFAATGNSRIAFQSLSNYWSRFYRTIEGLCMMKNKLSKEEKTLFKRALSQFRRMYWKMIVNRSFSYLQKFHMTLIFFAPAISCKLRMGNSKCRE